jgi:hypothetical protein
MIHKDKKKKKGSLKAHHYSIMNINYDQKSLLKANQT